MPVERRGSRSYVYRAYRKNGKVRKEYLGSTEDPPVDWYLRRKRLQSACQDGSKDLVATEKLAQAEFDGALAELQAIVASIVGGWLATQTYRIDKRTKEWRRMRRAPNQAEEVRGVSRDQYESLLVRVRRGDAAALRNLRQVMNANSHAFEGLGDLADHCKRLITSRVVGDNIQARESVFLKVREVESSLGIEDAGPTERLLIEQVSVAWLDVYHAEFIFNQDRDSKADEKHYETRLEKAQKRHADAVLNLERLRKIAGTGHAQTASPVATPAPSNSEEKKAAGSQPSPSPDASNAGPLAVAQTIPDWARKFFDN
jgi:hypothetical protein